MPVAGSRGGRPAARTAVKVSPLVVRPSRQVPVHAPPITRHPCGACTRTRRRTYCYRISGGSGRPAGLWHRTRGTGAGARAGDAFRRRFRPSAWFLSAHFRPQYFLYGRAVPGISAPHTRHGRGGRSAALSALFRRNAAARRADVGRGARGQHARTARTVAARPDDHDIA